MRSGGQQRKVTMEYTNCILCNKNNSEVFLTAGDLRYNTSEEKFTLDRCKECGIIFVNPRPSKSEMAKYYPEKYRPRLTLSASHLESRMKRYLPRKKAVFFRNPWYLDISEGTKVLDIGCGSGELLLLLKEKGCNAYGIDVDEVTTNYLRNVMNLNVITCDIDFGIPFQDGFFDAVFMRHSLEHFHNPLEVLKEVRRTLKTNGKLIIGIPNIDSLTAKFTGEYWGDLDIPRHLFHFSTSTIKTLVNHAGFFLEKIEQEMKISRRSLKKMLPAILSFLASKPVTGIICIAAYLLQKSEWIVVTARKVDG